MLQRPVGSTRVALVDTTLEGDPGDIGATLYRIQVTTGSRTDTIPKVRTMMMPGVAPDGAVYLFSYSSGGLLLSGNRYDPATRQLTDIQLPPGIELSGAEVATSPDARHIAYFSPMMGHDMYGVIRSWPDGKLVAQTPTEPWFESDVDESGVRWLDANRAEFAYHSGRSIPPGSTRSPNLWIDATVTLDPRSLKVDSLSSQPDWAR